MADFLAVVRENQANDKKKGNALPPEANKFGSDRLLIYSGKADNSIFE